MQRSDGPIAVGPRLPPPLPRPSAGDTQSIRRRRSFGSIAMGFGLGLVSALTAVVATGWLQSEEELLEARSSEANGSAGPFVGPLRSILLTIDDANRTGNYAVLRAISAPAFQAANSEERLAHLFAGLRQSNADLSLAAIATPVWDEPPKIDRQGLLRLRGRLPGRGLTIKFAVAFALVGETWRMIEIGISQEPHSAGAASPVAR